MGPGKSVPPCVTIASANPMFVACHQLEAGTVVLMSMLASYDTGLKSCSLGRFYFSVGMEFRFGFGGVGVGVLLRGFRNPPRASVFNASPVRHPPFELPPSASCEHRKPPQSAAPHSAAGWPKAFLRVPDQNTKVVLRYDRT